MSEEEKKAIESLKWYFEDSKSLDIAKQTDIVLNLIEKQQEKIEELKEKNRELLKERAGYAEEYIHNNPWLYKQLDELYIFRGEVDRKYISKDKIREKIKDLEDNMILFTNDKEKFNRYKYARDILEKLLEEK